MRALLALCCLIVGAPLLQAQVIRVPQRSSQPSSWVAFGIGYHDMNAVIDGGTGTRWEFGTGLQYRGSLEQASGRNGTWGLTGTYARLPMTHVGDPGCGLLEECDAHGDVVQLLGMFRMGGGEGFHQIFEFGLGVTHFRNFTADDTDEPLVPRDGDNDFTLAVSYGFGFGFSTRTQIFLVQDFATMWHQRHGLAGSQSNFVQQRTTRVGLRYGMGSRTTRR